MTLQYLLLKIKYVFFIPLILFIMSCSKDTPAPEKENPEEEFTKIILKWTNINDANDVVTTTLEVDDKMEFPTNKEVALGAYKAYTLNISFFAKDEEITNEISVEDGISHQLFFGGYTDNFFKSPTGSGNIKPNDDAVNYKDTDKNNLPIGVVTQWETKALTGGSTKASTKLRLLLKHQPKLKTSTSDSNTGSTDVDITVTLNVT